MHPAWFSGLGKIPSRYFKKKPPTVDDLSWQVLGVASFIDFFAVPEDKVVKANGKGVMSSCFLQ